MKRLLICASTALLALSCVSPRKNPRKINEEALASPMGETGVKIFESTPEPENSTRPSDFVVFENNLMKCEGTQGDLVKHCKIAKQELAPAQGKLSNFFLSYTMTCGRKSSAPESSKVSVKLENGQERFLNYHETVKDLNVGTGKGPLSLQDTYPKEIGDRSFNDCQFRIDNVRVEKVTLDN